MPLRMTGMTSESNTEFHCFCVDGGTDNQEDKGRK